MCRWVAASGPSHFVPTERTSFSQWVPEPQNRSGRDWEPCTHFFLRRRLVPKLTELHRLNRKAVASAVSMRNVTTHSIATLNTDGVAKQNAYSHDPQLTKLYLNHCYPELNMYFLQLQNFLYIVYDELRFYAAPSHSNMWRTPYFSRTAGELQAVLCSLLVQSTMGSAQQ